MRYLLRKRSWMSRVHASVWPGSARECAQWDRQCDCGQKRHERDECAEWNEHGYGWGVWVGFGGFAMFCMLLCWDFLSFFSSILLMWLICFFMFFCCSFFVPTKGFHKIILINFAILMSALWNSDWLSALEDMDVTIDVYLDGSLRNSASGPKKNLLKPGFALRLFGSFYV